MKPTLVILAAGLGRRFGGIKQLESVGPSGETIMDYSVYDALRAGFGQVVFVIRPEMETVFNETIGQRYRKHVPVEYAFQRLETLPEGFTCPPDRSKPWGTAHAILAAKELVREPFAVINADDFYGANSFAVLSEFLQQPESTERSTYAMVGFKLRETLTEAGSVSRGCCRCTAEGWLENITEIIGIERDGQNARYLDESGEIQSLSGEQIVSMNAWAFQPVFFKQLQECFTSFLQENVDSDTAEFYIPTAIEYLMRSGRARVKILPTTDTWVGVTHPEDKARVVLAIGKLVDQGKYPRALWG